MGCEGESERAFSSWLQVLCDKNKSNVKLQVLVAGGGDGVSIVETCLRKWKRSKISNKVPIRRIVILDSDRLKDDQRKGRNPVPIARKNDIQLIFLKPNLEGMLVRLHPNMGSRRPTTKDVQKELKKLWPNYKKPPTRSHLQDRFGLDDLQRVAKYDKDIQILLKIVNLNA